VAARQFLSRFVVLLAIMTLQLCQEPFDRHAHQLASAKRRHVAEYVSRIKTLTRNVQFQRLDQCRRDTMNRQNTSKKTT